MRKIAYHSDELLMEYQQFLVQQTGVTNVKLKYIMNQGYFIEITNKDIEPFEKNIGELLENDRELPEESQRIEQKGNTNSPGLSD